MALTDEVSVALTSVVRLTLPAERWPAVAEVVHRMDDSVWTGDEKALRADLKKLRSAVIGTAPRPRPGEGAAPVVNPLSYRTTDYLGRTPVRWISAVLIAGAALLAIFIVFLMVVLALGAPDGDPTTAPSTSVSAPAAPAQEPAPQPETSNGGVYVVSIGTLVLAGIGGFALVIWRRRVRARPRGAPEPSGEPIEFNLAHSADRDRVPADIKESAERLVAELARRRDS